MNRPPLPLTAGGEEEWLGGRSRAFSRAPRGRRSPGPLAHVACEADGAGRQYEDRDHPRDRDPGCDDQDNDRGEHREPDIGQQRVACQRGSHLGRWRRRRRRSGAAVRAPRSCVPARRARARSLPRRPPVWSRTAPADQAGGHPRLDETRTDDEHAHAARRRRVGEALGERIEPRLRGSVNRVRGPGPLGSHGREHDERAASPCRAARAGSAGASDPLPRKLTCITSKASAGSASSPA